MLPVNADLLRAVAPRQSGRRAEQQARIIEDVGKTLASTLEKYKIDTPLRLAHFIAQTCHESDGYCTTEEYASGEAYEGRREGLGNTERGDGPKFKGRGLIQLTGRFNYHSAGRRLGLPLIDNPPLAADPATSLLIACDYWQEHGLNTYCDGDNLIAITRIVNGGLNGLDSRRGYLAKAKEALARLQAGAIAARPGGPPTLHLGMEGEAVVSLQKALRDKQFLVSIDGVFGGGTETAVQQFQASEGLTVDGIVGPATWSRLSPS
jgi:putative chitinase